LGVIICKPAGISFDFAQYKLLIPADFGALGLH
jgi:hypothetical protein